jgi:hypothetical protein
MAQKDARLFDLEEGLVALQKRGAISDTIFSRKNGAGIFHGEGLEQKRCRAAFVLNALGRKIELRVSAVQIF